MSPAVWELDAQLRGRALDRMSRAAKFTKDDHSEGLFIFAGYSFIWKIDEFAGERCITLFMADEVLV